MVRIGTLPLRLLASKYGADVVFSPEIVDKSIIGATRVFNREINVIEYRQRVGDKVIFRCSPDEKVKLVIQIGSNDPERALEAARIFQADASGIDLNCGCPKHFSTHAGMGAALLENPELLCAILRGLVNNLKDLPISAKIRLLPGDIESTKQLVKQIISTGISALSIHGRTRFQSYDEPSDWGKIKTLVNFIRNELRNETIAINLCGDVFSFEDVQRAIEQIGVNGVMFARAAQWNVSIFSPLGPQPDVIKIICEYLAVCLAVDNHPSNSKFTIIEMLVKDPQKYKPQLLAVYKCKSNEDLAGVFSLPCESRKKIIAEDELKSMEDLEFGYSLERQEAKMFHRIEKLLSAE